MCRYDYDQPRAKAPLHSLSHLTARSEGAAVGGIIPTYLRNSSFLDGNTNKTTNCEGVKQHPVFVGSAKEHFDVVWTV